MRWYWIDRFLEFHSGRYAKAIKMISMAEDHLHDHFPGYLIMPNSLIVEGMAQTGGLLACEHGGFREKVILAKIPRAEFFCEARPGDALVYTATLDYVHKDGTMVSTTSHLGETLQAQAEIVFAHVDDQRFGRPLFPPESFLDMMRSLRAYEVGRAADGSPLTEPPGLARVVPGGALP